MLLLAKTVSLDFFPNNMRFTQSVVSYEDSRSTVVKVNKTNFTAVHIHAQTCTKMTNLT